MYLLRFLFANIILIFCSVLVFAQRQNNIWYFGQNAGVNFNDTPPTALVNGQLVTDEGCASIADANGNLLFYTNGVTLWNKNHLKMKNGDGLQGDISSTQAAFIVASPENNELYYVFTTAYGSNGGLRYSIINITGDNGLGEVTTKNVLLLDVSTEKITAVKHANNKDVWVIGHEAGSNKFYTWLVTGDGVSTIAIVTPIGTVHPIERLSSIGSLKASLSGTKLALGANTLNKGFVEIFDFNKSTGVVANPQILNGFGNVFPYGIEFSPNERFLYISVYDNEELQNLYQAEFPLSSNSITNSTNITVLSSLLYAGTLQLAPDGKIYLSQRNSKFLHAINFPDKQGLACSFSLNQVSLDSKNATLGLPPVNIVTLIAPSFSAIGLCSANTTNFELLSANTYQNISWDFDDPSSGSNNITTGKNPTHKFSRAGTFNIKVTLRLNGVTTSFTKKVTILASVNSLPVLTADKPVLCGSGEVNITATGATGPQKYNWYDADKKFIEQNNGKYTTDVLNDNATYYASITNGICEGEMKKIEIKKDVVSASITATDTIINIGQTVTLTANNGATYGWSPSTYLSSASNKTTISTPLENIIYKLTVTNQSGCIAEKSIHIIVKSTISIPNTFTPNDDGINDRWVIKNINYTPNVVQVYNRLGALVYSARNYDNSWAGTYTGKKLPAGVYYYRITLDSKEVKSGYVTIIR